eukprot:5635558-Amphidinium_carterae.1
MWGNQAAEARSEEPQQPPPEATAQVARQSPTCFEFPGWHRSWAFGDLSAQNPMAPKAKSKPTKAAMPLTNTFASI